MVLLHFRTPQLLLMTHHEKTRLKALLFVYCSFNPNPRGGYESAIAPYYCTFVPPIVIDDSS